MRQYPKKTLTIEEQIQTYIDAGMQVSSKEAAETALKNAICIHRGVIGYEIIDPQTMVISNGNCVFSKQIDGKQELIVKSRAINRNFTVINI